MRLISTLWITLALALSKTASSQSISPADFAATTFDVIIIGGGTAGLVVANRLSATSLKVGVIDAGTFNASGDPFIDVPTDPNVFAGQPSSSLIFNPKYDWILQSVPQTASEGKVIAYNRGKVLGGSSAINNMVWNRGEGPEYDLWATFGNGNDWTFKSLLPYFERSETWTPPPSGNAALIPGTIPSPSLAAVHGKSGPIHARYNTFFTDLESPLTQASANIGFPLNPNPDAGNSSFFDLNGITDSVDPTTQTRSYAASGYYTPAVRARKNLSVVLSSVVSRIIWDKSTVGSKAVKATAVEFISGGQTFTVKVSKEVILAAGTLKTPQVLELSGVGNSALLKSLGIPVTLNLPQVGENFMDHPMSFTDFEMKPGVLTLDQLLFNQTYVDEQKALYLSSRKGAFTAAATVTGSFPIQGIVSSAEFQRMRAELDAQIAASASSLTPLQKAQYNALRKLIDTGSIGNSAPGLVSRGGIAGPASANTSYMTLALFQLHEFSRGSVHINSTDPNASPLIDPKFMTFQWDVDIQVHGAQFMRKLALTKPISDLVASVHAPDESVSTDAQWADFLKKNLATISHPMGTTAMASQELGGVVDNRLRVYGLQNVRVVDASIIPLTIGAPIQATVYAIAEKASDLILQDVLHKRFIRQV